MYSAMGNGSNIGVVGRICGWSHSASLRKDRTTGECRSLVSLHCVLLPWLVFMNSWVIQPILSITFIEFMRPTSLFVLEPGGWSYLWLVSLRFAVQRPNHRSRMVDRTNHLLRAQILSGAWTQPSGMPYLQRGGMQGITF